MFIIALSAAAIFATGADAAPAANQAATVAAVHVHRRANGHDPDHVTCKYTVITGSRVPDRRKVCMTDLEWDQGSQTAQRDTRKMQNSLYGVNFNSETIINQIPHVKGQSSMMFRPG